MSLFMMLVPVVLSGMVLSTFIVLMVAMRSSQISSSEEWNDLVSNQIENYALSTKIEEPNNLNSDVIFGI